MATILADANVLLDILIPDQEWEDWSGRALAEAAESSFLVINVQKLPGVPSACEACTPELAQQAEAATFV